MSCQNLIRMFLQYNLLRHVTLTLCSKCYLNRKSFITILWSGKITKAATKLNITNYCRKRSLFNMTRYYFSVGRTHTTWDYMQLVDTVLYRHKHFTLNTGYFRPKHARESGNWSIKGSQTSSLPLRVNRWPYSNIQSYSEPTINLSCHLSLPTVYS